MKILAVDTAETTCSVALVETDRVLVEIATGVAGTHARRLMPMVHAALEMAGMAPGDLDGFVVSAGPGSFTGIRIGMGCVQGMAEAVGKPAVGVSSLAALARPWGAAQSWVCPMMDARRSQVYWTLYAGDGQAALPEQSPRADPPESVLESLAGRTCLFVGSGAAAYRERIEARMADRARFVPKASNAIRAVSVARCGMEILATGRYPARPVPVYLRQSDAERSRRPAQGSD